MVDIPTIEQEVRAGGITTIELEDFGACEVARTGPRSVIQLSTFVEAVLWRSAWYRWPQDRSVLRVRQKENGRRTVVPGGRDFYTTQIVGGCGIHICRLPRSEVEAVLPRVILPTGSLIVVNDGHQLHEPPHV
jgi:hypothetical protein